MGEPVVPSGFVVPLDVGVLLRLARLDKLQNDAASDGPVPERIADILGPIVATDLQRLAAPFDNLIQ